MGLPKGRGRVENRVKRRALRAETGDQQKRHPEGSNESRSGYKAYGLSRHEGVTNENTLVEFETGGVGLKGNPRMKPRDRVPRFEAPPRQKKQKKKKKKNSAVSAL